MQPMHSSRSVKRGFERNRSSRSETFENDSDYWLYDLMEAAVLNGAIRPLVMDLRGGAMEPADTRKNRVEFQPRIEYIAMT